MSRTVALNSVTRSSLNKILADTGVQLIGGDLDEAPMVYKNIEDVMNAQTDLVKILAKFTPKIVRMADAK
jgi:tRNA-splicing ligase RtcB